MNEGRVSIEYTDKWYKHQIDSLLGEIKSR